MVAQGCAWLLGGHVWLLPGGACMVAPGGEGVHGCSGGACMVSPGGACMVAPGGACVVARGACMVSPGGACMVAPGGGGMRGFFDEIRSLSRRYASYWNAFLSFFCLFKIFNLTSFAQNAYHGPKKKLLYYVAVLSV